MDNTKRNDKIRKREDSSSHESAEASNGLDTENDEQDDPYITVRELPPNAKTPTASSNLDHNDDHSASSANPVGLQAHTSFGGGPQLQNLPGSNHLAGVQSGGLTRKTAAEPNATSKSQRKGLSKTTLKRRAASKGDVRDLPCIRCLQPLKKGNSYDGCQNAILEDGTTDHRCFKCFKDGQKCVPCPHELQLRYMKLIDALHDGSVDLIEALQSEIKQIERDAQNSGLKAEKHNPQSKAKDRAPGSIATRAMTKPQPEKIPYAQQVSDFEEFVEDDSDENAMEDNPAQDEVEGDEEVVSEASNDTETELDIVLAQLEKDLIHSSKHLIMKGFRKIRKLLADRGESISDQGLVKVHNILEDCYEKAMTKNLVMMKDFLTNFLKKNEEVLEQKLSEAGL